MILSYTYFHKAPNYAFFELLDYPQDTENLPIKNLSTLKFSKGTVLVCYYKQQVNFILISPTYLLTLSLYVMQSLPVN